MQPKLAVYTHIVLLGGLTDADADLAVRTAKIYDGKVGVGEDLMSFEMGNEITLKEPQFRLIK